MQKDRSTETDEDGYGIICTCGGTLWWCGDGNFICDNCDLEWFRCELCNGSLHAYQDQELIFYPNPFA